MKKTVFIALTLLLGGYTASIDAQCRLTNGTNYDLPRGGIGPILISFSPDGTLLAAVNSRFDGISLFNVTGNTLSQGTSYALPDNVSGPRSISFSPDGTLLDCNRVFPIF